MYVELYMLSLNVVRTFKLHFIRKCITCPYGYRIIVVFVANANIVTLQFLLNIHCACTL